ncbi:hypothetical protein HQ487_00375 [Candidatus Uhrbacteria bacterium]|nr:hypothetical protein [Candidatus Uhrbacteria bacterium]
MTERRPSFYRDPIIREAIYRKSREIFGSREVSDEAIDNFFLLEGEKLSEEEKADVGRFVEHVSKRLVNAALHRPGAEISTKEKAKQCLFDPKERFGFISFHDPAHAIAMYDKSEGKSLVPSFLTATLEEGYTDPNVMLEEFPALIFSQIFEGRPLFASFLDSESTSALMEVLTVGDYEHPEVAKVAFEKIASEVDHKDFESVRRAYEKTIVLFLSETAFRRVPEHKEEVKQTGEEALLLSASNPDEKYLLLARTIFEQYGSNKKVLFQEFQRICGPLLERLRRKDEQTN